MGQNRCASSSTPAATCCARQSSLEILWRYRRQPSSLVRTTPRPVDSKKQKYRGHKNATAQMYTDANANNPLETITENGVTYDCDLGYSILHDTQTIRSLPWFWRTEIRQWCRLAEAPFFRKPDNCTTKQKNMVSNRLSKSDVFF